MTKEDLEEVLNSIIGTAKKFADNELPQHARDRLVGEIELHEGTLREMFEYRKTHGPELGMADTDSYFSEKVVGLTGFAKMAVDPARREGYKTAQILDNVQHFAHHVRGMLPVKD